MAGSIVLGIPMSLMGEPDGVAKLNHQGRPVR